MLKRLKIIDLFGIKGNNKEIDFNKELTILVGQNGSGKTTILNILNIILTKTFRNLFEYKFSSIKLETRNGIVQINKLKDKLIIKRLDIENVSKNFRISQEALLSLKKRLNNNEVVLTKFDDESVDEEFHEFISMVYLEIPNTDQDNSITKVYQDFGFDVNSMYFPTYRRLETDFNKLINQFDSDQMINRRYYNRGFHIVENFFDNNIIFGFSNKDIGEIISQKWKNVTLYEQHLLNNLIKDFIFALIDMSAEADLEDIDNVDLDNIKNDLEEAFKRTGLIHNSEMISQIDSFVDEISWAKQFMKDNKSSKMKSEEVLGSLNRCSRVSASLGRIIKMLKMYRKTCNKIEDIKAPFVELEKILGSFLKKKVQIKETIKFISGGNELLFEDLSAGEKQLVSLFIYTRLKIKTNSIVLIDEPELSLHVSWQRKFLSNLLNNKSDQQYIISTHSPFVISKYRENVLPVGVLDNEGDYVE